VPRLAAPRLTLPSLARPRPTKPRQAAFPHTETCRRRWGSDTTLNGIPTARRRSSAPYAGLHFVALRSKDTGRARKWQATNRPRQAHNSRAGWKPERSVAH
jgi:hypothetical protein